MHIYYNFRYKESEEKRLSDLMLLFTPLKNFDLLYSGVEPEPHQIFRPEPDPHKNEAAQQHCILQDIPYFSLLSKPNRSFIEIRIRI
jgi:hypothetical protein